MKNSSILFLALPLFLFLGCGQKKNNGSTVEFEKNGLSITCPSSEECDSSGVEMKEENLSVKDSAEVNSFGSREYLGKEPAVDLSGILKIYEENRAAEVKNIETAEVDLWNTLGGSILKTGDTIYLFDNNSFAVYLPQYAHSENGFLANAEMFYNSCAYRLNLWSNFEVWLRGDLREPKAVEAAIQSMGLDCVKDEKVKKVAKAYRDGILHVMRTITDVNEAYSSSLDFCTACDSILRERVFFILRWMKFLETAIV